MEARFHRWWKQTQQHQKAIRIAAIVTIIAIVLMTVGYWFNWTGFGVNSILWTVDTTSTKSPLFNTKVEELQPAKTLWDWLQLLIIPLVLAIGGYLFNLRVSKDEHLAIEQRKETERYIAQDNQQDAALHAYIDKMAELILHEGLCESNPRIEVRKIARVRTLTVLPSLNDERKRSVLQFLYESGLISKNMQIVDLSEADFSGLTFNLANLREANLRKADLRNADLQRSNLSEADLRDANLQRSNLSKADLSKANLQKAFLNRTNLQEALFKDALLNKAYLRKANLCMAVFQGAHLFGANLGETDLTGAILCKADLRRADLLEATLNEADLTDTLLSGAILSRCHFIKADLTGANLTGADLTDTNLTGANLTGADLTGANLTSADLTGAKVTKEQLEKAKTLEGIIMLNETKQTEKVI